LPKVAFEEKKVALEEEEMARSAQSCL